MQRSLLNQARIKKYELLQRALDNDEVINIEDYKTDIIHKKIINNEISSSHSFKDKDEDDYL